jgi:hypothetical protein|tara:strand:+ start:1120 stop:1332 length:213 start_codon:yes stop_codon:yes gene_type:complete
LVKIFLKLVSQGMNKKIKNKIKKLTELESECLSFVILNGNFQECFEGDPKKLKAFERAEKKLTQLLIKNY